MYAARKTVRTLRGTSWPYKQGPRRGVSGLGCAGCGGRCKGLGDGFDWSDIVDELPQLVSAGATGAANIIHAVDGSGSPVVITSGGQVVSTAGLNATQIAALQAAQTPSTLASLSPTTLALGIGGLGLVVLLATR